MSYYNPTKNPIPFYPLEGEVWTNFKPLWFKNNSTYSYQKNILFPGKRYFQLRVSDNLMAQADVTAINLRKVADNSIVPGISIARTLYVHQKLNRKYVVISMELASGLVDADYYVSVETNYGNYYSEIFCIKNNTNKTIGIKWASSKGRVGDLIYPADFENYINIEAQIVPGEPQIEEETKENGFGEEFPTLQILTQGFSFSFMAPNYLAQALSALQLHDKFQIMNRPKGDYEEAFDDKIKNVRTKVTPEEDGLFSFVEISYVEETIIATACEDDILAANNPPKADIVWNDTLTTEDRVCNAQDDCQQTLKYTEFTYDPDDNLDYLEWEKSSNQGTSWESAGLAVTDTKAISEADEGIFWYRLKAVDTYGAVGYSNILKYEVYDYASFASRSSTDELDCELLGDAKIFDVVGDISQNAKINFKVMSTYGQGFYLRLYDRITGDVLLNWSGGPAGTETDLIVSLDGAGIGKYRVVLCLNSCNGDQYVQAAVQLTLYKDDNVTLGNSTLTVSKFYSC